MKNLFKASPSLMNVARESFEEEYRDARRIALIETGLKETVISKTTIFTLAQVLNEDYLP